MTNLVEEMTKFMADMPKAWTADDPLFVGTYWERPELSQADRGDASVDPIFHAVGLALSQWETAESALADLFLILCECDNASSHTAIRRAFGSIESSGGRRKALEEAAEVYLGHYGADPSTKPFKKLISTFERASGRRNDIAHGRAHALAVDNQPLGAFLFPAPYNTGRNSLFPAVDNSDPFSVTTGKYRYTSATVIGFANKFGELTMKIFEYMVGSVKLNGVPKQILAAQLREQAK